MKIDPNAPAYPSHGTMGEVVYTGMPIRLALAAMVSPAVFQNAHRGATAEDVAFDALVVADALIAAFNGESK